MPSLSVVNIILISLLILLISWGYFGITCLMLNKYMYIVNRQTKAKVVLTRPEPIPCKWLHVNCQAPYRTMASCHVVVHKLESTYIEFWWCNKLKTTDILFDEKFAHWQGGRLCWTLSVFLSTQKSAQKSKNTQKGAFESKPTLTDRLTARTDQLTAWTDRLTARTDRLTARMDRLTTRTDRLTTRTDHLTARTAEPATAGSDRGT